MCLTSIFVQARFKFIARFPNPLLLLFLIMNDEFNVSVSIRHIIQQLKLIMAITSIQKFSCDIIY